MRSISNSPDMNFLGKKSPECYLCYLKQIECDLLSSLTFCLRSMQNFVYLGQTRKWDWGLKN